MEDYKEKYEIALKKAKTLLSKCKRVSDKASMIYRAEDIESMFPEFQKSEEERIREALIELVKCNERCGYSLLNNVSTSSMLAWLKKQGETTIWDKKDEQILNAAILHIKNKTYNYCGGYTSEYVIQWLESLKNRYIWTPIEKQGEQIDTENKEYWRGYREGKKEILDKYAELEKQDKQNTNIFWHDASEEPEIHRELFCEWKGYADNIWHDVAFYHLDDKAFWNGERPIPDVIKWAYIDDILKEQPQSQIKPKFKAGDTIQCVSDKTDIRTIAEIDTLYNVYRCENNYPIPFTQENMWKLI